MRCVALLYALLLMGCPTPARIPLVYDYPRVSAETAKLSEGSVTVEDRRRDSSFDQFIAGGMPATIKHIIERELAARWETPRDPSPADGHAPIGWVAVDQGTCVHQPILLHLQVQLSETSVEIPKKAGMTTALVTGFLLLPPPLAAAASEHSEANVYGHVQMGIQARNPRSGALCEDVWIGDATIKTPWSHVDNSQIYAKALGAAVKDAVWHLAGVLRCVGAFE